MARGKPAKKNQAADVSRPAGDSDQATPVSRNLLSLHRALAVVRSTVAPDITVQRLMILLSVSANEGLSQRELLETLDGCTSTALSRNLADLSRLTSKKRPGPGLVESRSDPMNLRVRRVYLTAKGRRLVDRIDLALAGQTFQSTKARSKT